MTDTDYINEHYPHATNSQKQALAERIAIMVIDGMVELITSSVLDVNAIMVIDGMVGEQKARQWAIFGKFED